MSHETTERLSIISCAVGDEVYGLDMHFVSGTARTDELQLKTDGASIVGWVQGKRGNIAVYSLANFLGRKLSRSIETQRVVLLETSQGQWGLLVDDVSQVWSVQMNHVSPLPALLNNYAPLCFSHVILAPEEREGKETFSLLFEPERLHPINVQSVSTSNSNLLSPLLTVAAGAKTQRQSGPGRLLLFSIGENSMIGEKEMVLGLSITQVPEVLYMQILLPVPGAPSFILGLINWRNRPVPVIDIATRFGLPPLTITTDSRVLICRVLGDDSFVGFLAHSVVRMLRLPFPHQLSERELSFNRSLCKTVVELPNETLVIPDVQRLVASNLNTRF